MTQYNINTDLGEAFSLAGKTPVFPITVPKVPPASGSPLLPASHTLLEGSSDGSSDEGLYTHQRDQAVKQERLFLSLPLKLEISNKQNLREGDKRKNS